MKQESYMLVLFSVFPKHTLMAIVGDGILYTNLYFEFHTQFYVLTVLDCGNMLVVLSTTSKHLLPWYSWILNFF